jgi:hypothetical protein
VPCAPHNPPRRHDGDGASGLALHNHHLADRVVANRQRHRHRAGGRHEHLRLRERLCRARARLARLRGQDGHGACCSLLLSADGDDNNIASLATAAAAASLLRDEDDRGPGCCGVSDRVNLLTTLIALLRRLLLLPGCCEWHGWCLALQ